MFKIKDIFELGCGSLVQYYYSSLSKILYAVYPEYDWLPWKFRKNSTKGLETNSSYWKLFLESSAKKLGVTNLNDWYKVKTEVKRCWECVLSCHSN